MVTVAHAPACSRSPDVSDQLRQVPVLRGLVRGQRDGGPCESLRGGAAALFRRLVGAGRSVVVRHQAVGRHAEVLLHHDAICVLWSTRTERLCPRVADERSARIQAATDVLVDGEALEGTGCRAELALGAGHVRIRRREREIADPHRVLISRHGGERLLIGLQVLVHVPVHVESGGGGHSQGQAARGDLHGIDVAGHPRRRGRAPLTLVDHGKEGGLRRHIARPERGGDHPHVRLEERRHRRRTSRGPGGKGRESVGRDHAGNRRVRGVGGPLRVEGVVGRRVVRGSALGRLPLVEVRHVGCGRRSGDPLQDAQFPARRQGGEAIGLRGRSPAGRPGQRAAAEAYCRQGQNESNASKDACHESFMKVDQDRCPRRWGARVRDLRRGDPVDRTRLARSAPSPNATIGWPLGSSDPSCAKHGCTGRGEAARSIVPADRRGSMERRNRWSRVVP